MGSADAAAENANPKGIIKVNIICTAIIALLYGAVVFLCAYVAQDAMKMFVESLPDWLANGFSVAGGILPAVGFAMQGPRQRQGLGPRGSHHRLPGLRRHVAPLFLSSGL